VLDEGLDDSSDDPIVIGADEECLIPDLDTANARKLAERWQGSAVRDTQDDAQATDDAGDEARWSIKGDNSPLVEDGDAVTEFLGLFHKVGAEEDSLATGADRANEIPDSAASVGIEPSGELIKEEETRIMDEGEGEKEALLLTAAQGREGDVYLVDQSKLRQELVWIEGIGIEGGKKRDSLAHSEPVGKCTLLQLDTDVGREAAALPPGVQTEDANGAGIGSTESLQALDGGRFAGTVGTDNTEDFTFLDCETHVVDGDN